MATEFTRKASILLSLALSCAAVASGQNSSAITAPGSASSAGGSNGFGAVNYSVSAGVDAAVSNATVNGVAPGTLATMSAAGRGAGMASSGPRIAGQSASSGRNASPAAGGRTSLGSRAPAPSGTAGSKPGYRSGLSISSSQVLALKSGMRTNGVDSSLAAKTSRGTALSRSSATEQTRTGKGSDAGGGGYAADFPDSTKNRAVISPPETSNQTLFAFEPSLTAEFPDLAEYQFLRPSLHVRGPNSSSAQGKEDLYRRIQRRLTEYKQAEAPKNGLKTKRSSGLDGFGSPFGSKSTNRASDKLNKRLTSGPSF